MFQLNVRFNVRFVMLNAYAKIANVMKIGLLLFEK